MRIPAPNFTQTPNDLFDYWLPHLKECELKVLLVIMRKTFGWHKPRDHISLSQLMQFTGLSETSVLSAIKFLITKKIVKKEVIGEKGFQSTIYELIVEDSNNSYPPQNLGRERPPKYGDGGVQKEGGTPPPKYGDTKETFAPMETTTNENKNVVVFFDCLKDLDIPEDDKSKITMKYEEKVVKNAIAYATNPQTNITKGLVPAIIWACQNPSKVPNIASDQYSINKAYAKLYDGKKSGCTTVTALNSSVEIEYGTCYKEPFILDYSENGFKDRFNSELRKCNFLIITEKQNE